MIILLSLLLLFTFPLDLRVLRLARAQLCARACRRKILQTCKRVDNRQHRRQGHSNTNCLHYPTYYPTRP